MKHPGELSWSFGPGPEAVERRMRAIRKAEQPDYAATTERLWREAQSPVIPHLQAMVANTFTEAQQQRRNNLKDES